MADPDDLLQHLIRCNRPEDAVASYYARSCPASRCVICEDRRGSGVLVTAEGKHGPVAIVRATAADVVPRVLESLPSRRCYAMAPWTLADPILRVVPFETTERNAVFWVDSPLLRTYGIQGASLEHGPDGVSAVVEGVPVSECGVLWRSSRFAEIAVATQPSHRGRGFARAAVGSMAARLLSEGVIPIYIVATENAASLRVAETTGFARCPEDEFAGYTACGNDRAARNRA